jgi:hypothetical protein
MAKPSEWQINVHYDGHPPLLTVKAPTLAASIAELVCHLTEEDRQALLDLVAARTQADPQEKIRRGVREAVAKLIDEARPAND